jgi:hypothetical protein
MALSENQKKGPFFLQNSVKRLHVFRQVTIAALLALADDPLS